MQAKHLLVDYQLEVNEDKSAAVGNFQNSLRLFIYLFPVDNQLH